MKLDELYSELTLKTGAKMALVVMDGLGDIATPEQNFLTPLEAAHTPNLDALVRSGCAQGIAVPRNRASARTAIGLSSDRTRP